MYVLYQGYVTGISLTSLNEIVRTIFLPLYISQITCTSANSSHRSPVDLALGQTNYAPQQFTNYYLDPRLSFCDAELGNRLCLSLPYTTNGSDGILSWTARLDHLEG